MSVNATVLGNLSHPLFNELKPIGTISISVYFVFFSSGTTIAITIAYLKK